MPKAGTYGSRDLDETRAELFKLGIVPKVTLDHKGRPARLKVACEDGSAVFVPGDERAAEVEAFLAAPLAWSAKHGGIDRIDV